MKNSDRNLGGDKLLLPALLPILLSVLVAGCGASDQRDPILGAGGLAGLAPTVTAVTPVDRSADVAVNTASIAVAFSAPIAVVPETSFKMTCAAPCANPQGTVALNATNRIALLQLTSGGLSAATLYTVTVSGFRSLDADIPLASPFVWQFTTGAAVDLTGPTVSSTNPHPNASGVAINSLVAASFSEPMDSITITTANFSVACPGTAPLNGFVDYAINGNVATFRPSNNLPASTMCTATIGTGVADIAGNPMANAFTWTFVTETAADTTGPSVSSTSPAANDNGSAINTLVTASFSEPMDALTISSASFTVACPTGTAVAGTVSYAANGNVATFAPSVELPAAVACTAAISAAVKDIAGNALAHAYAWSFTTGAARDTTAPTVSATSPSANSVAVATNRLVSASFSEPMDPLSITTADFSLACPAGSSVSATAGYSVNGNVATLTPAGALPASTVCVANITTGVRDAAGNRMAAAYAWSFTTGVAPDTTAPSVSATSPSAGANGVALNTLVTASFSEPMDALTVNAMSFTLACPAGAAVAGTVGYAVNGNVATFTPASSLPANRTCTAQVSAAVTDVAHNAMVQPFTWTFTTGSAPDTVAPTVSSTNPADGASGVCVNKTVNVIFSEPMDALTLTTATLTLNETSGAAIAGVVNYDATTRIATFTPVASLTGAPPTSYTVRIKGGSSGVKDLAGNALAADKVTTFTTNASTCATAPVLGAAAPFGSFGGLATLTNDGLNTVINGDAGVGAASTTITGLHDSGGNVYTITPNNNGTINGLVYSMTAPPGSVAGVTVTQARAQALIAFNSLSPTSLPGGIDMSSLAQCPSCGGAGGGPDELAGRVLPPGVYRSAPGNFDLGGAGHTVGSLTLDAAGDTDAVWVFQTTAGTGTLTVGLTGPSTPAVPIMMLLLNGAQPKNIFWYLPGGATVGTGSTVAGTLLANASITISTTGGIPPTAVVTTINGRAIALSAGVTMTNTVINVPAP